MKLAVIKEHIANNTLIKFYQCPAWRMLRVKALKRDRFECQHCKAKGKMTRAEDVHHIKYVKEYPEHALDIDNLVSLCVTCHNIEHDRLKGIRNKKQRFMNEERW
ncbi:HNH endonuclease [Macrococcoides caseolyticum]|uniref:HNH endonuclease n=1 Tax=Macrococcoides caseolyticum TaxID=69966 RepID=UPI003B02322F